MSSSEITPADSTSPITEEGIARLRERLGAYYGSGPHFIDITADDIRRYAQSNGDHNKLYLDPGYAGQSRFGGLIAPILWSGLLHSVLEVLNPVLNQRIEWFWFILSQIGFGVVAGIVVSKQERIRTWQHIPLGVRVGIETPGAIDEKTGENPPQ